MQFQVRVAGYWTVVADGSPVLTFAAYDRDEAVDVVRRPPIENALGQRTANVSFRHATPSETREWLEAAEALVQQAEHPSVTCIEDLWDANWAAPAAERRGQARAPGSGLAL